MQQPGKCPVLVFDIGNVLLEWDPRYLFRKLMPDDPDRIERFLDEVRFHDWNLQQDAGRSFAAGVEELCARFPAYESFIRAYDERWEESLSGPIQGTVEILRTLKGAGYSLYALSNWSVEKYQIVRSKHEFFNWFDSILISGEVKLLKPDPRIFHVLLDRIGRPAGECIFIDDSLRNIETAAGLGFQTIHFRSPAQLSTALVSKGLKLEVEG